MNSKKVIKLKQSDIVDLVKRVINENEDGRFGYGYKEIDALSNNLRDDEDVYLSDNSGELRGDVVKKKQYAINMLRNAIDKQDWSLVNRAIMYMEIKM